MDGSGASHRASVKRSFSTMASSHRELTPVAQYGDASHDDDSGSFVDGSYDERYEDGSAEDTEDEMRAYRQRHARRDPYDPLGSGIEHPMLWEGRERREREQREQSEQRHFPGDGFDYRRPMSIVDARAEEVRAPEPARVTETVDLTEDDSTIHAHGRLAMALPTVTANVAGDGSAARAQRLPRYDRDIIDIASSDEEDNRPPRQVTQRRDRASLIDPRDAGEAIWPGTRRTTSTLRRPGYIRQPTPAMEHDDVEIVASRNLSNRPSRRATPATMNPRSLTPFPPGHPLHAANGTIDLTADDDDDVILTESRNTRGGINAERPAAAGIGVGTRQEPDFGGAGIARLRNMVQGHGFPPRFLEGYLPGARPNLEIHREHFESMQERRRTLDEGVALQRRNARQRGERATGEPYHAVGGLFRGQADALIGLPMIMDYGIAAFDMGLGARPPTPPYEAPPLPSNGFTRSPEEEEVVVCPNCGDELATGKDEEKQQLWVIKQCGHAYCGTCINNRSRLTKTARGKGKAKAIDDVLPLVFSKCVVTNCSNRKKLTKTDLIRVWINS